MICIAGKNDIAVNSLEYLVGNLGAAAKEILIIPNNCDSGTDTWQHSLRKAAAQYNIQPVKLADIYDIEDLLFISLEFDKIIKTKKFKSSRLYNIHFSKLPAYKGMYTSVHPILNGEKEAGVTLHRIDDGIDTGEIIDQKYFDVSISDSCRDLYFKYNNYGFDLFKKNIDSLVKNNVNSVKQSNIGSTYYSKESIDFKNIMIDFNKTAFEIHNQLRAYIFKEYQIPKVYGVGIEKSILTERMAEKPCNIVDCGKFFEISGMDRYIIEAVKEKDR